MRLVLLTVAMPEAREFVESLKPYINILLVRKLFLQLLVASFHYISVYYCNFPSHTSWQIHLSFSSGAVLSNFPAQCGTMKLTFNIVTLTHNHQQSVHTWNFNESDILRRTCKASLLVLLFSRRPTYAAAELPETNFFTRRSFFKGFGCS